MSELRREVVSFARRDGRLSHRHQQAWDAHHARYLVQPDRGHRDTSISPDWVFDPAAAFGRVAPLVVEVGTGDGESILAAAQANPEQNFLAVEVYRPGLARTIVGAADADLDNLRILAADARALVETGLAPESVAEMRVFFADPWPKARHHKRRLVDARFVAAVARVLAPGGVLRLATDWADYAEQMAAVCEASELECDHPVEGGTPARWARRFEGRIVTRYERKGVAAGRVIRDLTFRRPTRR
ncbi:MAG: tRNA (guanosine(46)-N7)-methyltransferase TrmB [Mobilicoccus sp.]|nr:tRNA (guanosine(46)-N7)-methyltransferase TrmB [Mobilicoccus sp.]